MLPKAREIASGRWHGILTALGVDGRYLTGKHGPCPMCDGRDRWRFDDKEGRGTWFCNNCGAGDGFKLLELFHGWTYRQAATEVERICGAIQVEQKKAKNESTDAARRVWNESVRIEHGDPVWKYLHRRIGIDTIPSCLRYHPALAYKHDDRTTYHPAMVAAVIGKDGIAATVHRTYLTKDGHKASVEAVKKLMPGKPLEGGAIRLMPATEQLGVAEGIETALAACKRFGVPTWACVSSSILAGWMPPEGVRKVTVFGDNDVGFGGQAAAYALAHKLAGKKYEVEVLMPEVAGTDWCDK